MKIKEAAARTGVPAKTIRYYEQIGVIHPPGRAGNGYRDYDEKDLQALRFLRQARGLGFSQKDSAALLSLYHDQSRTSAVVKQFALKRLQEIDRKIADLRGIREILARSVERCPGDERPECPILDELANS